MNNKQLEPLEFPIYFWNIIVKSIRFYKNSFFDYLLLAIITYLPFLIFDQFSKLDILDLIEFFHGNFLDIIVFLTLPTLFLQKRVFPLATIQLFFQKFFASAVIISLIQLGTLLVFTAFFVQLSLGAVLLGIVPYIFLLFAGFFLILENSSKMLSIRSNLINSIKLVKNHFFPIFWNYINITILMIIPLFFFSAWYLGNHPEFVAIADSLKGPAGNVIMGEKLLNILQTIIQESEFKWSRIAIHVLFRPIKSLFLSFLFIGIIYQISPNIINSFLGIKDPVEEENPVSENSK